MVSQTRGLFSVNWTLKWRLVYRLTKSGLSQIKIDERIFRKSSVVNPKRLSWITVLHMSTKSNLMLMPILIKNLGPKSHNLSADRNPHLRTGADGWKADDIVSPASFPPSNLISVLICAPGTSLKLVVKMTDLIFPVSKCYSDWWLVSIETVPVIHWQTSLTCHPWGLMKPSFCPGIYISLQEISSVKTRLNVVLTHLKNPVWPLN